MPIRCLARNLQMKACLLTVSRPAYLLHLAMIVKDHLLGCDTRQEQIDLQLHPEPPRWNSLPAPPAAEIQAAVQSCLSPSARRLCSSRGKRCHLASKRTRLEAQDAKKSSSRMVELS